jgi:hypothetical protein
VRNPVAAQKSAQPLRVRRRGVAEYLDAAAGADQPRAAHQQCVHDQLGQVGLPLDDLAQTCGGHLQQVPVLSDDRGSKRDPARQQRKIADELAGGMRHQRALHILVIVNDNDEAIENDGEVIVGVARLK